MIAMTERTSRVVKGVFVSYVAGRASDGKGREWNVVKQAVRGQEVELSAEDEARLDGLGMLMPPGTEAMDEMALERVLQESNVPAPPGPDVEEVVEAPGGRDLDAVDESSHESLVKWLEESRPNGEATIAAAHNDPELARRILAAEDEASGGNPRKGVSEALTKIVEEA